MSQNVCYTFKGVNPFLDVMEALHPHYYTSHVTAYKDNLRLLRSKEAVKVMDEWVKSDGYKTGNKRYIK